MLLAPFDTERIVLMKITEYGSIIALGILLGIEFFPRLENIQQSSTLGLFVSSILSIFGSGRHK
jgi:hypothetical protein